MLPLLGLACVAWTVFELTRLIRTPERIAATSSAPSPAAGRPDAPRPRRRFAAWDDRGRPIHVEDLGHP